MLSGELLPCTVSERRAQPHLEAQAVGGEGELRGPVRRALGVRLKAAHAEQGAVAVHLHALHSGTPHRHQLPAVGEPRPL